jgi:putative ABC transport system ATP-binding protein
VLSARGLERSFRLPDGSSIEALRGADLDVEPGSSIAIQGRSGSGKSTLLSVLGLLEASGGTYTVDGTPVAGLSDGQLSRLRAGTFGFVFQRSFLLEHLTAAENVEVPLLHARRVPSRTERRRMVAAALERAGIAHRAGHRPRALSGGEQQLVALARALVASPRYLLADEPTGNLDSATGDRIVRTLLNLVEADGIALVMVTHDHELARALGSRRELVDGRLREIA